MHLVQSPFECTISMEALSFSLIDARPCCFLHCRIAHYRCIPRSYEVREREDLFSPLEDWKYSLYVGKTSSLISGNIATEY